MKRITQDDLLQLSQRHGFVSFADMCDNVEECSNKDFLAIDLMQLEKRIRQQISPDKANLPPRNGLADVQVDATGLPDLHDLIKTVVRMIVKLLVGYDAEEQQFLRDRALDIEAKHVHENHHRARMISALRKR
ncbi:MAG: hypothetical protein KGN32_08100 [Burkholderiales bacterium]|nr:hypothetical protein [Burkholderiales bacterium]